MPPHADASDDAREKPRAEGFRLPPSDVKLTGIVGGPGGSVAVINDRYYRVGDTINGGKIVKIGTFAVEVELDGQKYRIGSCSASASEPDEDTSSEDEASPEESSSEEQ